ncbi:hypothetical protein KAR34_02525 [bacterium]|nr:hypothetical protein [bacterium]
MTPKSLLLWCFISLAVAVVITFLLQKLVNQVQKTLPTWNLKKAQNRFTRVYPGKDIYQIVSYMIRRDRAFASLLNFLPWQCFIALFVLATLWAFVIPKESRFWLPVAQNLFIFEFMILALLPAFRLLQKMQRLTIARIQELLKQK